jgi:hypothetical protein
MIILKDVFNKIEKIIIPNIINKLLEMVRISSPFFHLIFLGLLINKVNLLKIV